MKLLNGIEINDRPIIGVDWSRVRGADVYDPKTDTVINFPNLEAVAVAYPGSFLVLEAPSESYELQRRAMVLEAFEKADIVAYCYKSQRTAWFRKSFLIKKSDKTDAKVIYRIATETRLSLHRFLPLMDDDPIREAVKAFLVKDRYLYNGKQSVELAKTLLKGKTAPCAEDILLSGKAYRKQIGRILAVAQEVRKAGRGYREFRRQLGNYGNGYASMPRSEFYHWWARMITNARLDRHVAKMLANITPEQRLVHRQVLKESTKAAKWLWSLTA